MLPEPEDVAKMLKRTLFRTKKEKAQQIENQRDAQVRAGKTRVMEHVQRQKQMLVRYRTLASKALSLNDENRFRQAGSQLLATQHDIARWEKYLLSFELLESKRDQVRAGAEMLEAVMALSASLESLTDPKKLSAMEKDIERGLEKADEMTGHLETVMDKVDGAISAESTVDESALEALEKDLIGEIQSDEAAGFDKEQEIALNKLRNELMGK